MDKKFDALEVKLITSSLEDRIIELNQVIGNLETEKIILERNNKQLEGTIDYKQERIEELEEEISNSNEEFTKDEILEEFKCLFSDEIKTAKLNSTEVFICNSSYNKLYIKVY